jgi:hypothetical protein
MIATKKKTIKIDKTSIGLRDALFDEINGLRAGTTTIARANTIHKLATQIILLTKTEMENGFKMSQLASEKAIRLGSK